MSETLFWSLRKNSSIDLQFKRLYERLLGRWIIDLHILSYKAAIFIYNNLTFCNYHMNLLVWYEPLLLVWYEPPLLVWYEPPLLVWYDDRVRHRFSKKS